MSLRLGRCVRCVVDLLEKARTRVIRDCSLNSIFILLPFFEGSFPRVEAPSVIIGFRQCPGFRENLYKRIGFHGLRKNRARYPKGLRREAANGTNFTSPNFESIL